jgi:hypothetical protein
MTPEEFEKYFKAQHEQERQVLFGNEACVRYRHGSSGLA